MKKIYTLLFTAAAMPLIALAGQPDPLNSLGTPIKEPKNVIEYIQTIGNWIFTLILALAVVYVLLAAYHYLTGSTGEGVEKAHKMILYAAVAITVAIFSKGIVYVVARLAGQTIKQNSI